MTRLLHIETATKVCSVALSEDGKLVDVLEESSGEYIHSEKLTIFIEEICKRNHWNLQDLQGIVVTSGPGSYTGLRIGVSTAKGLCFALDIPLISVNTIESISQLALSKYPDATICAMIDARRMEVFSGIYNNQMSLIKPLSADILEETTYKEFEPFLVCGDGAEKVKDLWMNRDIKIDTSIRSSARGQIQIAHQKYLNQEFEDVAYFEPMYLKDFMVTVARKKG